MNSPEYRVYFQRQKGETAECYEQATNEKEACAIAKERKGDFAIVAIAHGRVNATMETVRVKGKVGRCLSEQMKRDFGC